MKKEDLTLIETIFLTTLIWLGKQSRIVDYLEPLETLYYRVDLQMPKSHTEQYNLGNKFWYWYPLYTLGLFSTLAYVVTAMNGTLFGFYYLPTTTGDPTTAYSGIEFIMRDLQFGLMLRFAHRRAVQAMIVTVFLHMPRVYFAGSHKEPRGLNWSLGIVLISPTMVFGYTGYLLPWDQLAFWAGQIGVRVVLSILLAGEWVAQLLLDGFSLGWLTLQCMYIIHVFLLPPAMTALITTHIGIVWVQGIVEPH